MNKKSKADLHIHTNFSDGLSSPKKIVDQAAKIGLDIIAITDHNLIAGAQTAQKYSREKNLPIKVIVGEEITTTKGEIIGLFLNKPIPPFLTPLETAKQIRKQDGLIFIPHPHRMILGYSLSFKTIDDLVKQDMVDGIEIYNNCDYRPGLADRRKKENKKWQLAPLANSDSHHHTTVGHYYTGFQGETINDLKKAINQKKTWPGFNKKPGLRFNCKLHLAGLKLLTKKADYPGQISIIKRLKHLLKLIGR